MAISEACQVWIEQRCKEELDRRQESEDPKSLRQIGMEIASEILKYFEVKVNPDTIRSHLRRITSGSNDHTELTHSSNNEIQDKPSCIRDEHGLFQMGTAPGPGRDIKYPMDSPELSRLKIDWKLTGQSDREKFLAWVKLEDGCGQ